MKDYLLQSVKHLNDKKGENEKIKLSKSQDLRLKRTERYNLIKDFYTFKKHDYWDDKKDLAE